MDALVNPDLAFWGYSMPRISLDKKIFQIQNEVFLLGRMVENAMLGAVSALKHNDVIIARQIYADDQLINEKRLAIENAILILIATQQPIAHDLRLLAATLEIITEIERMGDYAKGIAKITFTVSDLTSILPMSKIEQMAQLAVDMFNRALTAFFAENAYHSSLIPLEDDLVDNLFNQVYQLVVCQMIANPELIDRANQALWIAHNIERMADRVTNICERTFFIATGELLEFDIDDDEDGS